MANSMNGKIFNDNNSDDVELLVCGECGNEKESTEFCDPTASEPHCKECAAGEWEMMGDDPCGKDWAS